MPSDTLPAEREGPTAAVPDERVSLALKAVAGSIANYHSRVVGALERVRAMLSADGGASRARHELGPFGFTRIDVDRFAELSRGTALDAPARARLARCVEVLSELAELPERGFVFDVPSSIRPYSVASAALARLGRAFGAGIAADLVRMGAYNPQDHDILTEAWGFDRWAKGDRRAAPPIVLTVDGSNLRVSEFAELLDGGEHIVLVVHGTCAPAPLARLITPNTFVLQTSDGTGLDRFNAFSGPAIAALVPEDGALFLHDPGLGAAFWQRLQISRRPTKEPRRSIGVMSAAQQRDELLQLDALATQPALPTAPIDALVLGGGGNATDRLADWLLAQSGLVEGK